MRNSTKTSALENGAPSSGNFAPRTRVNFSDVGERWAGKAPENEGPIDSPHAARDTPERLPASEDRASWPVSYALYQKAHAERATVLGTMIVTTYGAVRKAAERAIVRHRQRRHARVTYDTLSRLDDHTLRDLGFDRLEISSLAAESSGRVEATRIRTLEALEEQR
jgi:uncharacterized protein YjiS (DUF1127 family)